MRHAEVVNRELAGAEHVVDDLRLARYTPTLALPVDDLPAGQQADDREAERQRGKETERQRDRETERQKDRETDRQTDRQRDQPARV